MSPGPDPRDAEPEERSIPRRLALGLRCLVLLAVPLLLIGPSLRPGHRFLPQAPVMYPPLSAEHPEAAARAAQGANLWTGDRIFPVLSDQRELRDRLRDGRGWIHDERSGLGQPLLGNVIHGPFYPPNLLLLLLPPDLAAAPLAILSLFLAGAGLWALLARLGLDERACLFGALALQSVGFGVANLHYGMKVDAALWLPWCLWAVEGLRTQQRGSGPFLALFSGLSALAGFPPIAAFTLGSAFLVGLLRLRGRAALGRMVGGLGLGVALAAVQLSPTLAASLSSYRTPKDAAALAAEAAHPRASLGLVAPGLFGLPTEPTPAFGPPAAWWLAGSDDWERVQSAVPLEWDPYAGVIVVAFALLGVVTGGRRALAPAMLLLLSFAFAQGWPGASLLYRLPGLDGGAPTRAMSVAWIAWPWLGALGLDGLLRSEASRKRALGLGLLTLLLGGTLALSYADHAALVAGRERALAEAHGRTLDEARLVMPRPDAERAARRLAAGFGLLAAAGLGLVAAATLSRRPSRGTAALLIPLGLLAVEAAQHSRAHVIPRDLAGVELFPESEAMDALAESTGSGRLIRLDASASGLEDVLRLARPNLPWAYGIADVSSYVAFTPRSTVDWFTAIDPRCRVRSGVGRLPAVELLDDPRLDGAGVSAVLATAAVDHPRLEVTYERDGFVVHRRTLDAQVERAPEPPSSSLPVALGALISSIALVAQGAWLRASLRGGRP